MCDKIVKAGFYIHIMAVICQAILYQGTPICKFHLIKMAKVMSKKDGLFYF